MKSRNREFAWGLWAYKANKVFVKYLNALLIIYICPIHVLWSCPLELGHEICSFLANGQYSTQMSHPSMEGISKFIAA